MRQPTVLEHPRTAAPPRAGFRRVVVAVGADGGVAAIDLARQLAAPDAAFILARVHHPTTRIDPTAADNAVTRDRTHAVHLLRIAQTALDADCEIVAEDSTKLVGGLHRIAEREAADLLVLGPHRGVTDAQSALPGVLKDAPCAVAIAGQHPLSEPLTIERVGAAFCATPVGARAAHAAASIAGRHGAELHAMHVVSVAASPWMGPAAAAIHTLQRVDGTLATSARESIGQLAPPATPHVVEGDPRLELLTFAKTVDLLAIGARAHGPQRRMVLGNLLAALSVTCSCALLVVAGPDAPEPSA